MAQRATSSFTLDKKDFTPAEWAGGGMMRARYEKTFTGDLSGTSIVEAIMLRTDDEGPALYVAIERFDCMLHGRAGSFLLLHQAMQPGESSWTIAEGTGLGELQGIQGTGEITPGHGFTLDYEIRSAEGVAV